MQDLIAQNFDSSDVEKFWRSLDDDYFMRHNKDEIVWHTQSFLNCNEEDLPLISVREQTYRGGTELFVFTHDENYIFALITAGIERLGLDIIDARIITSRDGYALDTFILLENDGNIISDPHRIEDLKNKLRTLLTKPSYEKLLANQTSKQLPRQLKHFPIATEVTFRSDPRNLITIMEIIAQDQPGLLARIAMALVECKAQVLNAKIATFGARAEDIFYITNEDNKPIESVEQLDKLKKTIIQLLEQ